jgi:hypothetical protein
MTSPTKPFINEASQSDRYAVVVNDKHAHKNTMLSHTHPELEMGGRFAAVEKQTVVGNSPIPNYGHAASWSETQLPDEPPTNYCINDMECVGTEAEIRESINALGDASHVAKSEDDAAACPASPRSHFDGRSSYPAAPIKGSTGSKTPNLLSRAAHPFKPRI